MEQAGHSEHIRLELESFREQWRKEVQTKKTASSAAPQQDNHAESSSRRKAPAPRDGSTYLSSGKPNAPDIDDDYVQAVSFDEPKPTQQQAQANMIANEKEERPVTALEHYELAVKKEAVGKLGDSLDLYRKAFRMDHRVDQKYKNKHFAAAWAKPAQAAQPTKPSAAAEAKPLSMEEMIASFAGLTIEPAPPIIKGDMPPPCPIARLPEEILVHILQDVAIADPGDFVRLARVCKQFAWLVSTEDHIWRRICLGAEFGFAGMHYAFRTSWSGEPLTPGEGEDGDGGEDGAQAEGPLEAARRREEHAFATTSALLNTAYHSSWQAMFRSRPRIRFNGCYIATVNYMRSGQSFTATWSSPVVIVTYYRYLRFYRDGTAISLLTIEEPADVVHHLTRENLALHAAADRATQRERRDVPGSGSVMHRACRGRWRLSCAEDDSPGAGAGLSLADSERDVFVEYGPHSAKYRMELSLRSAGRAARNNKLVWRGFYGYDYRSLRGGGWEDLQNTGHDKPFFFSRVKSYGFGL